MFPLTSTLLSLLFLFGAEGLFRVPLKRIHPPDHDVLQKYVHNLEMYNTGSKYLQDYGYVQYVGKFGLGTPEQPVNILVDTGIPAFWVSSSKFDPKKSTTYQNLPDCHVSRPYTTGKFNGLNKKDALNIAGAKIHNQSFELVYDGLEKMDFDGVLGLAYPSVAPKCGPEVTPVQNMVIQSIASGVFGFRYNKDASSEDVGEVIFGGIDQKYVDEGSLSYIPVINKPNWAITLDSLKLENGQSVLEKSAVAIIDSSSPVIAGPLEPIKQLYKQLTGGDAYVSGTVEFDCDKVPHLPNLVFTFNAKTYSLEGKDYVLKFGNTCWSSLVTANLPDNQWLLGDVFLKKYYAVFDQSNDKVAFGELKKTNEINEDFRYYMM